MSSNQSSLNLPLLSPAEGLVEVAANLRESLAPLLSSFVAFAETIQQVDWNNLLESFNQLVRDRIKMARLLAGKGWTVPPWTSFDELELLSSLDEAELDSAFTEMYVKDEFKRLEYVFDALELSAGLEQWRALLGECRESILVGRFRVTIPALLTILEGYAIREVLRLTGPDAKQTNLAKLFQQADHHNETGIQAVPWISNLVFLQHLFARSDFDSPQPQLLNRHWVLHGRSQRDWILADALRLITAIGTMGWAEAAGNKRPYTRATDKNL